MGGGGEVQGMWLRSSGVLEVPILQIHIEPANPFGKFVDDCRLRARPYGEAARMVNVAFGLYSGAR